MLLPMCTIAIAFKRPYTAIFCRHKTSFCMAIHTTDVVFVSSEGAGEVSPVIYANRTNTCVMAQNYK